VKKSNEYPLIYGVSPVVKTIHLLFRLSALCACVASSVSCMTTYDAYGRPVESVDPGLAVAGIAAAGLIGYAISEDHGHDYDYHGHGGHYDRGRYYNRGGYYSGYHGGYRH